jgi:hypothetical protein
MKYVVEGIYFGDFFFVKYDNRCCVHTNAAVLHQSLAMYFCKF